MKFREHRELLVDSMKTVVEIQNTTDLKPYAIQLSPKVHRIEVKPYGGDDDRIGWKDVHIVVGYYRDGTHWVLGFTEGPVPSV